MDSATPQRKTISQTITTVRFVAQPFGNTRENPPSLGHLRAFVMACEGIPDDTRFTIDNGPLDEGGRRNVTFSVRLVIEDA